MTNPTNQDNSSKNMQEDFDVVLNQLTSRRASEVWRGMDQVKQWLKAKPEDRKIYELLLDAVQRNPAVREQINILLVDKVEEGSITAKEALSLFPTISDLLVDADDAYYGADLEKAIELYSQILRIEPENKRAKEQLEKTRLEFKKDDGSNKELPPDAIRYFRKARSYIAAGDFKTAATLLSAAIEAAEERGIKYPEAEQLLESIQNLFIANGHKEQASDALMSGRWRDALIHYEKALTLNPSDKIVKNEFEAIKNLLQSENELRNKGIWKIITPLGSIYGTLRKARDYVDPDNPLLNYIENQLNQIMIIRSIIGLLLIVSLVYYFSTTRTATSTYPSETPTINIPPVVASTGDITQSVTSSPTATNTSFPEKTSTLFISQAVDSFTPTPKFFGKGYINVGSVNYFDFPNGSLLGRLNQFQFVTILETRVANGLWYRCVWETNEISLEGWIIADYVTIGLPPSATP